MSVSIRLDGSDEACREAAGRLAAIVHVLPVQVQVHIEADLAEDGSGGPGTQEPAQLDMADGPREAASILHRHRHRLAPDILRTLQDVWVCASAARYGQPYETGWAEDPDAYRNHDTAACEQDDDEEADDADPEAGR